MQAFKLQWGARRCDITCELIIPPITLVSFVRLDARLTNIDGPFSSPFSLFFELVSAGSEPLF